VARVVAALGADHHISRLGEHVDDFPFSFVAPLGANQDCVRHISAAPEQIKNPET
jgi:hypothetical protein